MFKKKFIPLFLIAIFILPMIFSGVLFYYYDYFSLNTTNHGILLNPPIQVGNTFGDAQKKWQIIYIAEENCREACEKVSHSLSQVQKALGKESYRVVVKTFSYQPNMVYDALFQYRFTAAQKIYLVDPAGNLFM